MITKIKDMPKLESPFKRILNANGKYVVVPEITPGYEWVFEDPNVLAIEKLHGTNVSIIIQDGIITAVYNRTERIPFFNKGKAHIIRGILKSYERGLMENLLDGQHWGELIGEKINGNPYNIKGNIWIPFETYGQEHLAYKSWGKYPKTFDAISEWFKEDLMPLYCLRRGNDVMDYMGDSMFVEGVVFTSKDGKMSKLRRDMFSWYSGPRHKENETDI